MSSLYLNKSRNHFVLEDQITNRERFSVNSKLVDIVTSACSMIWDKNAGHAGIFIVGFVERIANHLDVPAAYLPDADFFLFALTTMQEQSRLNRFDLFLLSAHEAYHKFQCFRGDKIFSSTENKSYPRCPFEKEAWIEAVDAFKAFYPSASGRIKINMNEDYFIEIPKTSSYHAYI